MKKHCLRTILLSLAALALLSAPLAGCFEEEHTAHTFGAWEEVTAASCTENGVKKHVCTYPGCGYSETEDIPATGHVWGASKVTEPATCQHGGKRTKTCTRCQTTQTEDTDKIEHDWIPQKVITAASCNEGGKEEQMCSMCKETRTAETPALGHAWGDPEILQAATCEQDGEQSKRCTRCQTQVTEVIPKYNHLWKNTATLAAATCETPGRQEQTCQRPTCGAKQTVEIKPLGHSWQGYYTVDKQATFTEAGSKSYHCNRCDKHNGETEIPRLDANTPITYEFRTLRNNGQLLIDPSVVLIVTDKETGKEVARSTRDTLAGGVFITDLLPKEYTVTMQNLPAGYTAAAQYTVTPFDPYCNLYLTASPRTGQRTGRYSKGSVMYDFTVPAESTTVGVGSLKQILSTKRMVLLNFWYVGCTYCEQEFPGLEQAYVKYGSDIEVLAVNNPQTGQTGSMAEIRGYGTEMGLTFPLVQNSALDLASPFGVASYPTSVVIDAEGVVCEILEGYTSQAEFEAIFAKYGAEDYLKPSAPEAENAASPAKQYALPAKRSYDM